MVTVTGAIRLREYTANTFGNLPLVRLLEPAWGSQRSATPSPEYTFGAALTTKLYRSKTEGARSALPPPCLREGVAAENLRERQLEKE